MPNIIIRRSKQKDLILSMSKEKVYFLFHYGQMIDNNVDYNFISDKFNDIERG